MTRDIEVKKEEDYKSGFLPKLVNKIITPVDFIIIKMGIWYKILFLILFPTVTMYFPINFILSGGMMKYLPQVFPATRTIFVFFATGLFIVLAVTLPKVATFVEVILSAFYILLMGFGVSNFIFYQFNTYNRAAHNTLQSVGLILCSLLLFGKTVFFIYKLLRRYRRNHMRRISVADEYFDHKFYDEKGDMILKSVPRDVSQENYFTDADFLVKKEKVIEEENLPDMSGFIVDNED